MVYCCGTGDRGAIKGKSSGVIVSAASSSAAQASTFARLNARLVPQIAHHPFWDAFGSQCNPLVSRLTEPMTAPIRKSASIDRTISVP